MTDGGMACFFCVLYGCPQLRGLQFQAVCLSLCVSVMSLSDMLGGAEAVPGQTGSRCPSRCRALLPPKLPRPLPHRTRAYPQASEKPAC